MVLIYRFSTPQNISHMMMYMMVRVAMLLLSLQIYIYVFMDYLANYVNNTKILMLDVYFAYIY